MKSILSLNLKELNEKLQSNEFELSLLNYQLINLQIFDIALLNYFNNNKKTVTDYIDIDQNPWPEYKSVLNQIDHIKNQIHERGMFLNVTNSMVNEYNADLLILLLKNKNSDESYYCFVDFNNIKDEHQFTRSLKLLIAYNTIIANYFSIDNLYYFNELLFTQQNEVKTYREFINKKIHVGNHTNRDYSEFKGFMRYRRWLKYYHDFELIKINDQFLYRLKENDKYDLMIKCFNKEQFQINEESTPIDSNFDIKNMINFVQAFNSMIINEFDWFDYEGIEQIIPNVKLKSTNCNINDSRLIKQMALVGEASYIKLGRSLNNLPKTAQYEIDEDSLLYEGNKKRIKCVDYSMNYKTTKIKLMGTYEDMMAFIYSDDFHKIYQSFKYTCVEISHQGMFVYLNLISSMSLFNDLSLIGKFRQYDEELLFMCEPSVSFNQCYLVADDGIYNYSDFKNLRSITNITKLKPNITKKIDDYSHIYNHLAINNYSKHNLHFVFNQSFPTEKRLQNKYFIQLLENIE